MADRFICKIMYILISFDVYYAFSFYFYSEFKWITFFLFSYKHFMQIYKIVFIVRHSSYIRSRVKLITVMKYYAVRCHSRYVVFFFFLL